MRDAMKQAVIVPEYKQRRQLQTEGFGAGVLVFHHCSIGAVRHKYGLAQLNAVDIKNSRGKGMALERTDILITLRMNDPGISVGCQGH